jgi:hypothetical protein
MITLNPISPYSWLSHSMQVLAFWMLTIVTVVMSLYLAKLGALLDARLPAGIIDLEASWSSERAQRLLFVLGTDGIKAGRRQTYLDFVFLMIYPIALSLGGALLAGTLEGKNAAIGMLIAWAVLLALPFDAIENICMLIMFDGHTDRPWPQLTTICAAIKFALAAGGALFICVGTVAWLARHLL